MEKTLKDGRPWIMGDQFTLVETTCAPFIKVLEMLRLLDLWIDGRPNVKNWWERISGRESLKALEEYPGQGIDENAPHAKAGLIVVDKVKELINTYRQSFPMV